MKLNKGAMFGLDARIALAIFGALSVISGAALYSAIQDSRAAALLVEMQEVGKAWESHLLDTGSDLRKTGTSGMSLHMRITIDLIEDSSSLRGWSGPYLPYGKASVNILKHPVYSEVHVLDINGETWGLGESWYTEGACSSGKQCFAWAVINGFDFAKSTVLMEAIDRKVDNSDGDDAGNFRWSGTGTIFLKIAPVKNPND